MNVNRSELCRILGVSLPTINGYVEKGMPYISKPDKEAGKTEWLYDTVDVIAWLVDGGQSQEKRDETAEAKLRQLQAESGIKWMEFGEKKGALIHISDIMPHFFEAASIVKSRIGALPGRLAQKVAVESDAAICQRLIKEEVDDALEGLNVDLTEKLRGE